MYEQNLQESEKNDNAKVITVCDHVEEVKDYENDKQKIENGEEIDNLTYVNFYMSGKYIYSKKFSLDTNISQIKYEFSNKYKIDEKNLQIMHCHVFLNDCATLRYIPSKCRCIIDLTVVNMNSETPLELQNMVIPDIITVRIESEDVYKEITVEIEDRSIRKPYIGGYRNKDTGIEYHHAYSQTGPPKGKVSPREKNTRDTQTIDTRNRLQQMLHSRATQINNENVWIPIHTDKILTAKIYETAEEREERLAVLKKIITIQRYYRRWKLNKSLEILCAEYRRKKESEELAKQQIKKDDDDINKKDVIAKIYPRTKDDFRILYAMLDRWKKAHIKRIAELHTPAAKLAEYYMLLNKEIEILRVIDKQRQQLKEDAEIAKEINFFETISKPIEWTGYKGLRISMDTLETQLGRKFKEIYYIACNHNLTKEERLKFLWELSAYLKEHNCAIGNEIVELLEREIQLLNLGIENKNLDMLHKRIQALLLKHYKTPECNLNVTGRMTKLKAKQMKNNLLVCTRCQTVKLAKDFANAFCDSNNCTCISCTWNDQITDPLFDVGLFRLMLNDIRRDERRRGAQSSISFVLQEKDLNFLFKNIWHSKSALTECSSQNLLKFVRWDVNIDWSPWNCILLTEEEANIHLRIKHLEDVYDEDFRKFILTKHLLARCIFFNISNLEKSMKLEELQKLDEPKNKD